ncbi:MAG: histidine triad nucleotide-binding protein [Methylacidiphilales bacterium]|nr:histidine triad nucleotide-binding protein [Candidatus Methylacidiphilales bacterium]
MKAKTIFQKIADREISARIVYETPDVLAFHDANPQAPVHILVIPKKHYERIAEIPASEENLLGKLLLAAGEVARKEKISSSGYRIVINNGPHGGETVPHLHVHVLGGRNLGWPPG